MTKRLIRSLATLLVFLICLHASAFGQRIKKDSLSVQCFLTNAVEAEPDKEAYDMGDEIRLILTSATDTVVRAAVDATITTLQRTDDGKWEVAYYHNDYWFWVAGLQKVTCGKQQKIKASEPLGIIPPGGKIEIRLYDFETPVDVKKFMRCNK